MRRRYSTHLASVLAFHLLVIFGSWQLFRSPPQPGGKKVMKMILSNSEIQKAQAPVRKVIPQKKASNMLPVAPKTQVAETQTENNINSSALSSMARADLKEMFKAELRNRIEANKFYPAISKKMGHTGTVVIGFTLLSDGTIINAKIDQPCEFEQLNKAGLEAVKKIKRFKEIPSELGLKEMEVTVPLKFVTI